MSQRNKLKKNRRMNDFIRRYWCYVGHHVVPTNDMRDATDLGKPVRICVNHLNYKTISDEEFNKLSNVRG